MIYQQLALYYDSLVEDPIATQKWVDFTIKHSCGKKVLDMACGSGDFSIELAKHGYELDAFDFSEEMLKQAKAKPDSDKVNFFVMDMNNYQVKKNYDIVTCYCDSLNYLIEDDEIITLFKKVYQCLHTKGTFLFDVHSIDRLDEFKEEFYEEGTVHDLQYEWSIQSDDDQLYQNFIFFDQQAHAQLEQHRQRVYQPSWIKQQLELIGFKVEMFTDFDLKGIQPGEKIFFVGFKEE
ncbi:MAG: class I SAM-dependent methyltransferase [Erysipelotrichaceae bacterium]